MKIQSKRLAKRMNSNEWQVNPDPELRKLWKYWPQIKGYKGGMDMLIKAGLRRSDSV